MRSIKLVFYLDVAFLFVVAGGIVVFVLSSQASLAAEQQNPAGGGEHVNAIFERAFEESQQLREQSRYLEAAERLQEVIALAPTSILAQQAAIRAARRFEEGGMILRAIEMLDTVIGITDARMSNTKGIKEHTLILRKRSALYDQARLYRHLNNGPEVRAIAQQLHKEFPESTICAEVAFWDAQLNGGDIPQAEQILTRNREASELINQIFSEANKDRPGEWVLQQLDQIITSYPDTPTSIKAREAQARHLWQNGNHEEACQVYSAILERIGYSSPTARIVRTAQAYLIQRYHERLQANKQKPIGEVLEFFNRLIAEANLAQLALEVLAWKGDYLWDRGQAEEACRVYSEIVQRADRLEPLAAQENTVIRNAKSRLLFYPVHHLINDLVAKRRDYKEVSDEQWRQLRGLCAETKAKDENVIYKAKTDLVVIESYHWQNKAEQTLAAACELIRQYNDGQDAHKIISDERLRGTVAWAHFYAGDALHKLGRLDEALKYFRWIQKEFEGDYQSPLAKDILPGSYFWIYYISLKSEAPADEYAGIADIVLSEYPESVYAGFIRRMQPD